MERYLIDTNVLLEILLGQAKSNECKSFISNNFDRICISDFSFHSIGVILFRLKKHEVFDMVSSDLLSKIPVLALPVSSCNMVGALALRFNLDFDDAYQTAVAQSFDLTIVTMDNDFIRLEGHRFVTFL